MCTLNTFFREIYQYSKPVLYFNEECSFVGEIRNKIIYFNNLYKSVEQLSLILDIYYKIVVVVVALES